MSEEKTLKQQIIEQIRVVNNSLSNLPIDLEGEDEKTLELALAVDTVRQNIRTLMGLAANL